MLRWHVCPLMSFDRKDKYQKGVYLYWVDVAYTGEKERLEERRLEDECSVGSRSEDGFDMGAMSDEDACPGVGDDGSSSAQAPDSENEKDTISKKKTTQKREKFPGVSESPSPKKAARRSKKKANDDDDDDMQDEVAAEAMSLNYLI